MTGQSPEPLPTWLAVSWRVIYPKTRHNISAIVLKPLPTCPSGIFMRNVGLVDTPAGGKLVWRADPAPRPPPPICPISL